jgi:2'-5' RNA ligase
MAPERLPSEATSRRLFVAFEVPDDVQDAIDEAIAPLRDRFPAARWVARENRHVTLKFLGPTPPRLGDRVRDGLGTVARGIAPIETGTTSIGAFPGGRRARVLWAGLDDTDGRQAGLARALDRALAPEFPPETRAFTPHCTVARSDPPLRLAAADLDVALRPVTFTVERVVLFRSHLRRPAPRYEPIASFPLTG